MSTENETTRTQKKAKNIKLNNICDLFPDEDIADFFGVTVSAIRGWKKLEEIPFYAERLAEFFMKEQGQDKFKTIIISGPSSSMDVICGTAKLGGLKVTEING
jgi:hypothetical protein